MATSTFPTATYPKLRALRQWIHLGCKVERMSRREREWRGGRMSSRGRFERRGLVFIPSG
jgi:hypothetical protein